MVLNNGGEIFRVIMSINFCVDSSNVEKIVRVVLMWEIILDNLDCGCF